MPSPKKNDATAKPKEEKKDEKVDLGLLEEDDEFEEFPAEEIKEKADAEDLTIWEDNWDDDNIEDDFSLQLKKEMEKQNQGEQMQ